MKIGLVLFLLTTTGCGAFQRTYVNVTGDAGTYCHKGILYLQFSSGAALAVDESGKPLKCK